jgi:hypothetical protein
MAPCGLRSIKPAKAVLQIVFAILLAGCSVQLTAPYDPDIDRGAGALQLDFFKFVANMQTTAGTPKGYYSEHEANYNDFEARLAVMRLRSEAIGGVPCARALGAAEKVGEAETANMDQQLKASLASRAAGGASCITILITMAQEQMASLGAFTNWPAILPSRRKNVRSYSPRRRSSRSSTRVKAGLRPSVQYRSC